MGEATVAPETKQTIFPSLYLLEMKQDVGSYAAPVVPG